jgi:formate dehydrogenase subunit gamma
MRRAGLAALALLAAFLVAAAIPSAAQDRQPSQVNPTALSVQEQQLMQQLQRVGPTGGPTIGGRVSIPDQQSANLIKPSGREWQTFHQVTLPWIGAVSILGMVIVLAAFRLTKGKIPLEGGYSGSTVVRFNTVDRFAHWLAAGSFIVLGITGLNITFGKFVLLPVIGGEAFTAWSQFGKYLHNYLSFAFMLGVALMFVLWVKDNVPNGRDVQWLKEGGGLIGHGHPKASRFNAGQKLIFWTVILSGVALSITGVILLFPLGVSESGWKLSQILHGLIGLVAVAVILAHIYIGSIGMEGAFEAMGSGEVDLNWARQHHALWLEEEAARKSSAGARAVPAE